MTFAIASEPPLTVRVGVHTIDRTGRENARRVEEARAAGLGNGAVRRCQSAAGGFASAKEEFHERRKSPERRWCDKE